MNCDESRELILDVVYGEEVDSRACFNFFRHLDECRDCSAEYKEFLSTREMLKDWELDEPAEVPASVPNSAKPWIQTKPKGRRLEFGAWWSMLQKVAAGFLILMGIASIFQHYGYLGGRKVLVSEQRLAEMVQDMIVINQKQERELLGQMLVHMKEDVELQRREDLEDLYGTLVSLEQRYAQNLEENNRYLKLLLSSK